MASGFDFFIQPRGPQIDVSLFPDAYSKGVSAGKELGSPLGSVVSGVERGLQITEDIQQNQIRRHQIERQPQEDKLRDEYLESLELKNDVAALEVRAIKANEDIFLRQKKAELESATFKAEQENQNLKNKDQISKDLMSPDPYVRRSILTNPAYGNTILNDPSYAKQLYGALLQDPVIDQQTKEGLLQRLDLVKAEELRIQNQKIVDSQKTELAKNFEKIRDRITTDPKLGYLQTQYNLSIMDLANPNTVEVYPKGVKALKEGTDEIDRTALDDDAALALAGNDYDVFIKGKKVPLTITGGSETNPANMLLDWQNSSVQLGLVPRLERGSSLTSSVSTSPSPTPGPKGVFSSLFQSFFPSDNPIAASAPEGMPSPVPAPAPGDINISSDDRVTQQRAYDLRRRAETDPDLKSRLVAKGLLKDVESRSQLLPPSSPTAVPSPVGAATPEAQTSIPPATANVEAAPTVKTQLVPTETITPSKVNNALKELPSPIKAQVDTKVVTKVLKEPLLSDKDSLYKAVAAVESGGNRKAENKGAVGLFQLRAAAAKDTKVYEGRFNPEQNVEGGIRYINQMLRQFGNDEIAALMAYYIGPGIIQDARERAGGSLDYEDLMFQIRQMLANNEWEKYVTSESVKHVAKYPFKVMAYKYAFDSLYV